MSLGDGKQGRRKNLDLVSLRIAACTALIQEGAAAAIVQASLDGCIRLIWIGWALACTELQSRSEW